LGDQAIRRARVRAQLLSGRTATGRTVEQVVSTVVGIQAQDLTAAALSIRARHRGVTAADVGAAPLVLTWTLRGTRHLHHRDDVGWLVGLLGPAVNRPEGARARQLGIAGFVGDGAVSVLTEALAAEGPLSRREVRHLLAPHGVDPTGQAPIHVIRRAALEGVLAIVPGKEERYVPLDRPLPVVDPAVAAAELCRRYLSAFGPATAADFAAWSGLGATAAREAWTAVGDSQRAAVSGGGPVGVRLLPAFDTFVLGYADRSLHLAPEHARSVNAGGGMVRPTVLIDGIVTGTWSHRRNEVVVSPFRELTPAEAAAVEREARAVRKFSFPEAGVNLPGAPIV
jgi:hypothetical protein